MTELSKNETYKLLERAVALIQEMQSQLLMPDADHDKYRVGAPLSCCVSIVKHEEMGVKNETVLWFDKNLPLEMLMTAGFCMQHASFELSSEILSTVTTAVSDED